MAEKRHPAANRPARVSGRRQFAAGMVGAGGVCACRRNSAGVSPVHWRKARLKLFSLLNPAAWATCLMARRPRVNRVSARSRRTASFKPCRLAPCSCNWRCRVRGDNSDVGDVVGVPDRHIHKRGLCAVQRKREDVISSDFTDIDARFPFDHSKTFRFAGMVMVSSGDPGFGSGERNLSTTVEFHGFNK